MTAAAVTGMALVAALAAAQDPTPGPPLEPLEAAALARVRASLPQRTTPELSEPLVRAARALARASARGDPHPLSASNLRAALVEAGAIDPAPAAVAVSAPPSSLPEALAAAARFRGASHVGIGVVPGSGLAWAVLLASGRGAELDPLPRRVATGSRPVISGRLVGLHSPRVWLATPAGDAFEVPVEGDAERFSARLPLDVPGIHRVEVAGSGPRGPTVAALVEIACGDAPRPAPPPPEGEPDDLAQAEERVRAAVDALRAARGLPPLARSAPLDAQARRHAEAMRAAATVAHVLAPGEDLRSRLDAAGVPFRSARENVARGEGALDAHRATVESPAHLASLLDPAVKLLGLGISRGALPGGQPVAYLAEILVEPPR